MHPTVALGLVVAVIACVAGGGWPDVVVTAGVCAALLSAVPGLSPAGLPRTLWRLRFFYLSLLILYAWFSPGAPLVPALGRFSPSLSGLATASRYIAALVVIATLVQMLMAWFRRDELVAALRWWLGPCRFMGLDPDRVALRLMLVAEVLPRLRDLARQAPEASAGTRGIGRLVSRASGVFAGTIEEAETVTPPTLELPCLPPPAMRDWALAVAAVALLALI